VEPFQQKSSYLSLLARNMQQICCYC